MAILPGKGEPLAWGYFDTLTLTARALYYLKERREHEGMLQNGLHALRTVARRNTQCDLAGTIGAVSMFQPPSPDTLKDAELLALTRLENNESRAHKHASHWTDGADLKECGRETIPLVLAGLKVESGCEELFATVLFAPDQRHFANRIIPIAAAVHEYLKHRDRRT